MRAQTRGARLHECARQRERLRGGIVSRCPAPLAFVADAIGEQRADFIAIPRTAPVALVDVRVAFDEARQQQRAAAIFDMRAGRRRDIRAERFDTAIDDRDGDGLAIGQPDIG